MYYIAVHKEYAKRFYVILILQQFCEIFISILQMGK